MAKYRMEVRKRDMGRCSRPEVIITIANVSEDTAKACAVKIFENIKQDFNTEIKYTLSKDLVDAKRVCDYILKIVVDYGYKYHQYTKTFLESEIKSIATNVLCVDDVNHLVVSDVISCLRKECSNNSIKLTLDKTTSGQTVITLIR